MSDDDKDWDDIIEQEDNPYNNPDDTFDNEDSAYIAGHTLGLDSEGVAVDLDSFDYPSMATDEIILAFKQGFEDGAREWVDKTFGDDIDSDLNAPAMTTDEVLDKPLQKDTSEE